MKSIKFYPSSRDAENKVPPPKPAKEYIPEWYKQTKIFDGGSPVFQGGEMVNKTVKSCVPFYDAYQTGYIQETWCDIYISAKNDGSVEYHYPSGPDILKIRKSTTNKISSAFFELEFAWQVHWVPRVEKGYSLLFTQPFNRLDLPFMCASGIVDSDNFYHQPIGNFPFYIYKNFEGIIPTGTPMFQIIPVKREPWKSESLPLDENNRDKRLAQTRKYFIGSYKRFFHEKKSYQ